MPTPGRVAIIIPCLNEAATIAQVISEFRASAPTATVYVVDNGSTDDTAAIGRQAGARIIREPRRGKGRALRTAFALIDADIFVLVDGDGQQPADRLPAMLEPVLRGEAEMVVGSRAPGGDRGAHAVNRFGNRSFSLLLQTLLRTRVTDVLSGYRVIRKDALRQLRLGAGSFEIEVELTIKAIQHGHRIAEVPVNVRARPSGNPPRLRVLRDGLRILASIVVLLLHGRPLPFFGSLGGALLILAAGTWRFGAGGRDQPASQAGRMAAGVLAAAGVGIAAIGPALVPLGRQLGDLEAGEVTESPVDFRLGA